MRGLVRLLIMFGPMIFRQIQKFQRSRQRQVAAPQPSRQPARKTQAPVKEEEYYEEELPEEDDFVDPINK